MTVGVGGENEVEILSREQAARIAKECVNKPDPLKSRRIPPSLLSAEHIREYVLATGLVSPFYIGGIRPRLKKASYECRIGSKAFEYRDGKLVSASLAGGSLNIPANSIVFVESELDFRLPEFIAARFNLQIRHVHRGILLGTGPIIDPGYWGKLCIPLHNLTSLDYKIPLDEGLIWIEFTKTTSRLSEGSSIGASPGPTGSWDIEQFIKRASRRYGSYTLDPIQSSIPEAVSNANARSAEALEISKSAEESVRWFRRIGWGAGTIGTLSFIFGALGVLWAVILQVESANRYVDDAKRELEKLKEANAAQAEIIEESQRYADQLSKFSDQIGSITKMLDVIQTSFRGLSQETNAHNTRFQDIGGDLALIVERLNRIEDAVSRIKENEGK